MVDDEPYILEGLKHIVKWEEYGLEVAGQATNGMDALVQLKNIHILVTDVKMPEMTGLELIKRAKQMYPDLKTIILSGYEDFEYVKEGVKLGIENYLLKPLNREEFASTLSNIVDKIESEMNRKVQLGQSMNVIRENILYRLVTNAISKEELHQKANLLNIDLDCDSYLIAIIHILSSPLEENPESSQNTSILSFSIRNIISRIIMESGLYVTLFSDHQGDIILLFSDAQSALDDKILGQVLERCISTVHTILKVNLFITAGSNVDDYDLIHHSYSHARELQEYHLVFPPNYTAFYTEIKDGVSRMQNDIQVNFEVFKNLLVSGKQEEISVFINTIFTPLMENGKISPVYIRNLVVEVLVHLNNSTKPIIRNKNFSLDYQNLIVEFSKKKNVQEIREWLKQMIFKAIADLKSFEEKTSPIIDQVLRYLNQNYYRDISIKTLACNLNINAAYLGQLFKKETGEIFSEFLFKFRMEKAKQMLADTSLKANEIAERIGYNEASYFYKSFKKYTGISFSEYRRLH